MLPLSHDEVVHGKGSLLGKMPGDRWQKFANLRAYLGFMWTHPGKKLLFMGGEFGQEREWNHDQSLDWHLLDDAAHRRRAGAWCAISTGSTARRRRSTQLDCEPAGFDWIDGDDADQSVFAFLRAAEARARRSWSCATSRRCRATATASACRGRPLARAAQHRRGVYGGIDVGNGGGVTRSRSALHGRPHSLELTLAAAATLVLEHADRTRGARMSRERLACSRGCPYPLGRHLGRLGRQLRALLGQRHAGRALPVRRDGAARDRRASSCRNTPTRSGTATCPDMRPGQLYGYRVHGPYEPHEATASIRTSCCSTPTPRRCTASCAGTTRCSAIASARRAPTSPSTGATARSSCPSAWSSSRPLAPRSWGDDEPPARAVGRHDHLRGARQGHHASRHPTFRPSCAAPSPASPIRAIIDHLRQARRHRDRAAAGPRLLRRPPSRREGPKQLLGLQHDRLLRARHRATCRTAATSTRFKLMVHRLHEAGIEVILDVVYNHTAEGNQLGPDALLPRHRQRQLLPAGRRPALLFRHHRLRQHDEPAPSARAADGHGFAALLGRGMPCRRLPLRSRDARSGASTRGFDPTLGFFDADAAGPGAVAGQADRRALGHRRRTAISSAASRRAGPNGTAATATTCAATGRATTASAASWRRGLLGSADLFDKRGPAAVGERQLRHRA